MDVPHISSTELIFSEALRVQFLHSFLMNLAKIPAFRLVLALPRYWRLCSAISMFVESRCVTVLTCMNLNQILKPHEYNVCFSIQMYSETKPYLIFPLVLLCPSFLAMKYPEEVSSIRFCEENKLPSSSTTYDCAAAHVKARLQA